MRVLLSTDGSESADRAVQLVGQIAWPPGTSIRVLSVVRPVVDASFGGMGSAGPGPTGMAITPEVYERVAAAARAEAERITAAAVAAITHEGREIDQEVFEGRAASVIVEMARDFGADLVVLGSRGRGPIAAALLGSVSAEVVESAPCPVLVARSGSIRRIVLAHDGSAGAEIALRFLETVPVFKQASVRVVTVQERTPNWYGWLVPEAAGEAQAFELAVSADRQRHAEILSDAVGRLKAAGLAAQADPREGDPAHEIIAAAKGFNADLVVTGTRGRTGLTRIFVGSVARNVVQHAPCSVLVVRDSSASAGHDSGRPPG